MTKIEQVARAIWGRGSLGGTPWENAPPEHQRVAMEEARRAIAAMREPSEGMVRAGVIAPGWEVGETSLHADHVVTPSLKLFPAEVWRAMVDTALAEGEG